ncbi:MAG: AAA family ATPase [Deferribacteraceae bacterium]|jgi:DNA replication and repair protein RecF|nr:AAA family ATPase [Deferribacteraceae bacterium]
MALSRIELQNFRNHKSFAADIPRMIYICGDNGAGKTSLAESLFLLLTLKTFRREDIANVKSFHEQYMCIKGVFTSENIENAVYFYQNKRILQIDGSERQNLSEYIFMMPVICYSPGFESFFSPHQIERRNFLDRMIFYAEPLHLNDLKQYNALLARKRAELNRNVPDEDLITIINEQALPFSETISARRKALVEMVNSKIAVNPELSDKFLPGMKLALNISSLMDRDEKKETDSGRPIYGSHKDLLYLKQNGKIIEKFQSFGQKKSALLYILYHLAIHIEECRKCDIMIILDDFEAGLDVRRCDLLNGLFLDEASEKRQLFLTGLDNRRYIGMETLPLTV